MNREKAKEHLDELTSSGKIFKYVVFAFNFLIFIAGLAILGGSITALLYDPVEEYMMGHQTVREAVEGDVNAFHAVLIFCMVLGGFLVVVGFLGCAGAIMESQIILAIFVGIVSLIIFLQFVMVILLIVDKKKVRDSIVTGMKNAEEDPDVSCDFWSNIQSKLECCGAGGSPAQFCTLKAPCDPRHDDGCGDALYFKAKEEAKGAWVLFLIFMLIELGAVIFGLILCIMVRKKQNEVQRVDSGYS